MFSVYVVDARSRRGGGDVAYVGTRRLLSGRCRLTNGRTVIVTFDGRRPNDDDDEVVLLLGRRGHTVAVAVAERRIHGIYVSDKLGRTPIDDDDNDGHSERR